MARQVVLEVEGVVDVADVGHGGTLLERGMVRRIVSRATVAATATAMATRDVHESAPPATSTTASPRSCRR